MFSIGKTNLTQNSSAYIIAEIGVNHNGDIHLAKKMIDEAVICGANAVKFQTFKSEKLVSKNAKQAVYQQRNNKSDITQLEMLKQLELTFDDFKILKKYCEEKAIDFLSTPFDVDSAILLKNIGVHALKVSSGDLTNIPFLKYLDTLNLPIILSTGMSNLGEIEEAVAALDNTPVAILHCTSDYPAPLEDVNLKAIQTLQLSFGKLTGYSDHTEGSEVSIAAVVLGAKILEKHFTLDKNLPGPDQKASMEPSELKNFICSIRNVELSLGNGIKKCMPSELNTKEVARKSLVVNKDMYAGSVLTEENIEIKRPGNGIEPKYYNLILGKTLKKDIKVDESLTWDFIL